MAMGTEQIPEIAAGAGFVLGIAADAVAMVTVAHRRARAIEQGAADIVSQPSRRQKIASVLTSSLVITSPLIAYVNADAWTAETTATTVLPSLELVIDHSGGAAVTPIDKPDAKPAVVSIDAITEEIAATKVTARALVAGENDVKDYPVGDVANHEAAGIASLPTAVNRAMDSAVRLRAKALSQSAQSSVGIVVVTNGNALGDAQEVIDRAHDLATPITIVNVESSVQDAAVVQDLKTIANKTGGSYQDIDAAKGETVAKDVVQKLKSERAEPRKSDDEKFKKIIGGVTAAMWPFMYRRRRNEPVVKGYNLKGKK